MAENNYILRFSEPVKQMIWSLVVKYHLELDLNMPQAERRKRKDPEVVIFHLAEKILKKEGQFSEISQRLKVDLGIQDPNASNLANEIKSKVVPMAEVEEEAKQIEEKQEEAKKEPSAQEIILEKIRGGGAPQQKPTPPSNAEPLPEKKPEQQPMQLNQPVRPVQQQPQPSVVKQVETKVVEDNAKIIKQEREETSKPGTVSGELQRKGQPDRYREPIEQGNDQ